MESNDRVPRAPFLLERRTFMTMISEVLKVATDVAPASLTIADLQARRSPGVGIQAGPGGLEVAGAVDHAGKSRGHYPEQTSNAGEQEHRCDGELNGVCNDSSAGVDGHGVTSLSGKSALCATG